MKPWERDWSTQTGDVGERKPWERSWSSPAPAPMTFGEGEDASILGRVGEGLKNIGTGLASGTLRAAQSFSEVARPVVENIPGLGAIERAVQLVRPSLGVERAVDTLRKDVEAGYSPEFQAAGRRLWWDEKNNTFGDAWGDWRSYARGLVESLPEQVLSMGPAQRLARAAYLNALERTGDRAAAGKAAARAAMLAGGAGEAVFAAGASAQAVEEEISRIPEAQLRDSDAIKGLMADGYTFEAARAQIVRDVKSRAMLLSGVATGAFGGMGDRILAKAIAGQAGGMVRRGVAGAVGEGVLEEFPQSYLSKVAENVALREVDPDRPLTQGALNEALGGLAVGGIQGAGQNVIFGRRASQEAETAPVNSADVLGQEEGVSGPPGLEALPYSRTDAEMAQIEAQHRMNQDIARREVEASTTWDENGNPRDPGLQFVQPNPRGEAPAPAGDPGDAIPYDGASARQTLAQALGAPNPAPTSTPGATIEPQRTIRASDEARAAMERAEREREEQRAREMDALAEESRRQRDLNAAVADAAMAGVRMDQAPPNSALADALGRLGVRPDQFRKTPVDPAQRELQEAQSKILGNDIRDINDNTLRFVARKGAGEAKDTAAAELARRLAMREQEQPSRQDRVWAEKLFAGGSLNLQERRRAIELGFGYPTVSGQWRLTKRAHEYRRALKDGTLNEGPEQDADTPPMWRRGDRADGARIAASTGGLARLAAEAEVPTSADLAAGVRIARDLFKRRVVFFRYTKPVASEDQAQGFILPGDPSTIYVNADATQSHLAIIGHELLHALRRSNSAVYQTLLSRIKPLMRNSAKYKAWLDAAIQEETGDPKAGASQDLADEELIADFLGDRMNEPQFWRDVLKGLDRPMVMKIRDAVMLALDVVRAKLGFGKPGFGSEQYLTDINAARKALAEATAEWVKSEAAKPAPSEKAKAVRQAVETLKSRGAARPAERKEEFVPQRDMTATDNFKRWAEGLPLVRAEQTEDYEGGPAVFEAFHGTTHSGIEVIDTAPRSGTKEGWLGNGFYTSTSRDDVSINYAGEGPDLTGRIERSAEQIADGWHGDRFVRDEMSTTYLEDNPEAAARVAEELQIPVDEFDYWDLEEDKQDQVHEMIAQEAIRAAARAEVAGDSKGLIMPLWVKLKKPFDMRPGGLQLTVEIEYDEDGEDIINEGGTLLDFAQAVRDVAGGYDADASEAFDDLVSNTDGMSAYDAFNVVTKGIEGAYDDNGESISGGQIVREAAERLGYDGIVMDADMAFGSGRGPFGRRMSGVYPGTLHVMPFERTNVKSALGNSGAFDPSNPSIVKSRATRPTQEPEKKVGVDEAANEAATSPKNDKPTPSDAQKEAGNYPKGHVRIAGLDISIENPAGSSRRPEWPPLKSHYGYFKRTLGKDGDHVDVFIKPGTPTDYSGPVYVVDQTKANGHFDEHKVMLGWDSPAAARDGYLENYEKGWSNYRTVTGYESPAEFKAWLDGDTTQESGKALMSRGSRPADPIFYSELMRQVEALKRGTGTPSEWKLAISSMKTKGVKAEEIEWSGVMQWLDLAAITRPGLEADLVKGGYTLSPAEKKRIAANPGLVSQKITKDQVLGYLRNNEIKLGETLLSSRETWRVNLDVLETRGTANLTDRERETLAELRERFEREGSDPIPEGGQASFDEYTLPGGENYRELLLQLEPKDREPDFSIDDFIDRMSDFYGKEHIFIVQENYSRLREDFLDRISKAHRREYFEILARQPARPYSSPHFTQQNILAHVRFNDRLDASGRRVLFIEEIQSDWAQAGRRSGFKGRSSKEAKEFFGISDEDWERATEDQRESYRLEMLEFKGRNAVPAGPFVTKTESWVALVLKRMLRWAVKREYDSIAWTTGEQQAARYDLSRQVKEILYDRTDGRLRVFDTRGGKVIDGRYSPDALAEVIGKEAADRVVNDPTTVRGDYNVLEGAGLVVGGEGMKSFYDRIVPSVARDVLKKLGGGQVTRITLQTPPGGPNGERYSVDPGPPNGINYFDTLEDAIRFADSIGAPHDQVFDHQSSAEQALNQPGFVITRDLRERAGQSMPLFSRGSRPRPIAWQRDGEDLVSPDGRLLIERLASDLFQISVDGRPVDMSTSLPEAKAMAASRMQDVSGAESRINNYSPEQVETLVRGWRRAATVTDLFQFGRSNKTDLAEIANEMRMGRQVKSIGLFERREVRRYDVEMAGDKGFILFHTDRWEGNDYPGAYVDTSDLGESGLGRAAYQLALTWAHNNKVPLFPDRELTPINTYRRTEQMISAALRLGSTRYMRPHPAQLIGGWIDNPQNQIEEDRNLASLLLAAYERTAYSIIPVHDIWYNFETQQFESMSEGERVDPGEFVRIAEASASRVIGSGVSSLARNAFTRSLLEDAPGAKAFAAGVGDAPLFLAADVSAPLALYARGARPGGGAARGPNEQAGSSDPGGALARPQSRTARAGLAVASGAARAAAPITKTAQAVNRAADAALRLPLAPVARVAGRLSDRVSSATAAWFKGGAVRQQIAHGVVSDYGLPEPYLVERQERERLINATLRRSKELIDRIAGLSLAEARVAYQWMQEKPNTQIEQQLMAVLPADSRATLTAMKEQIDTLGREAVQLGLLSEESYQRNKMAYLHRTYEKHELEDAAFVSVNRNAKVIRAESYRGRGLRHDINADRLSGAKKGDKFVRMELRDPPTTEGELGKLKRVVYIAEGTAIPAKYASWRNDGVWEARWFDKDGTVGMWRDLSKEERERLGEIEEIRYAFARTSLASVQDIETARFLGWVAQNYAKRTEEEVKGAGGRIAEASDTKTTLRVYADDEWVQVPASKVFGTQLYKYGKLVDKVLVKDGGRERERTQGLFIPGHIWNDIRATINFRSASAVWRLYDELLRAWKISKTALSPAVHTNNIMANVVLADLADVGPEDLRRAITTIIDAKRGNPEASAMMERFYDSGSESGSYAAIELREEIIEPLLKQMEKERDELAESLSIAQAIRLAHGGSVGQAFRALMRTSVVRTTGRMAAAPFKAMIDMYRQEDAVFRLAKFLNEVAAGKSDRDAGSAARVAFLDYRINAPWIQAMRRGPFPFIAFTYRVVPLLIDAFTNKPWKMVKYLSMGFALNALAYGMLGSGGDEEKERKLLPDEKSGNTLFVFPRMLRMPWNDEHGSPVFLDVRRWIPGGDIMDLNGSKAAIPVPPWMSVGGPIALLVEMISNRSQFTGKDIVGKTDSAGEKTLKIMDHLAKFIMPNLPIPNPLGYAADSIAMDRGLLQTYSWKSIQAAGTGETDAFGRERDLMQALSSSFGVKLGSYPSDVAVTNLGRKRDAELRELSEKIGAARRALQKRGIDEEEFKARLDKNVQRRRDIEKEYAERMRGAM